MAEQTKKTRTLSGQNEANAARPTATGRTSRTIASCFALAAFAVAVLSGWAAGNPPWLILLRAIFATLICYPVGLMIGMICTHVVDSHLRETFGNTSESKSNASEKNSAESSAGRGQADEQGEPAPAA